MEESSGQWVFRADKDQVKGPYTTEELRAMIVSGNFSGTEEICQYPQGEWQVLTKQPEFYDALLESLENPIDAQKKKDQKQDAETVIKPGGPPVKKPAEIPKFDLKEFVDNEIKAEQDLKARMEGDKKKKDKEPQSSTAVTTLAPSDTSVQKPKPEELQMPVLAPLERGITKKATGYIGNILKDRDKKLEILMVDLKKIRQREVKKMFPALFMILVLAGVFTYFVIDDETENSGSTKGWSLVGPTKTGEEPLNSSEVNDIKKKAVLAFQNGVMEQLLQVQVDLSKSIEGSSKDLEAMGLLCMAHEQLWPFTQQTEQDLKSVLSVTQLARSANPLSNFSDTCQSVYLLLKGQNREAKSLIEKTLDNPTDKFTLATFLYFIKGEMLEYEASFVNAEAYYDQASKLWPQWITARFAKARMLYKQNKMSEARAEFEKILKDYPESKAGLMGMGLVELKTTRNKEKMLSYFSSGFKIKQKIHKDFYAEALISYANLLKDNGDNREALRVAQEAYRLAPGNRDMRELVHSLGGETKIDSVNPEVVLIGDQFVRAGDHLTAQAQFKAAFELNPKNAAAAYKAAKSLWQINQTREAINWLEKAINADKNFLPAYILKADYESQKYNFNAAQKTLAIAASVFSQNQEVTKALALLEFRKNNMYSAIQYGERALRMYDADVELLTMLAQAHIYVYMNAPTVRKVDADKKDEARKSATRYATKATTLEPAWPESQITYAKLLGATDGPVREEGYLKNMIKAFPYTIEYRLALAEFYKVNEKFAESAAEYEEVVGIDPKNKKANFGLAETYRVLNKVDQAQKYYDITSTLDPSDVEPLFSNAKLLIETASGREARAHILQALTKLELVKKINPDFPKVSFTMARCFLELGDYDKALELIADEKKRNPSIADSYILAAEIYYRRAQFKECAAENSAAIKLRPNSAELYVKASICYRNSDSLDIAEDMLEMARDKESGYAEIFRELGYINDKKGQKREAVKNFEIYLVLSPNALDRDEVNKQISRLGGAP
jgi:tetratricopeptide (TPR) repeat protein